MPMSDDIDFSRKRIPHIERFDLIQQINTLMMSNTLGDFKRHFDIDLSLEAD